jgi:molybdopterin-guanine dinucleotide biosynthesis protein A
LAAALRLAVDEGYRSVLTIGVDSLGLPEDLPQALGEAPACLRAQPIVGRWPAAAATTLEALLHDEGSHSVLRFAEAIGTRLVDVARMPANINTPADLITFRLKP